MSARLALLFAGQGGPLGGLGAEVTECPDCRPTLAVADRALGQALSARIAAGSASDLRLTEVAQPALLTVAVAEARHLIRQGLRPEALAGHSLGQYAALVVAGALDLADAVRLVAARGRLMQAAVPDGAGAMVAVVGLERAAVAAACAAARGAGAVGVACHNAPGITVVSGARAAVEAAAGRCEAEGAGVVPLEVSVPFHCELLAPMVPEFAALVRATAVAAPAIPVVDNVTARPLADAAAVRGSLVAQVTAPVLFEESLAYLIEAGFAHFVQCGPGDALLKWARRLRRPVRTDTFAAAAPANVAAVDTEARSHSARTLQVPMSSLGRHAPLSSSPAVEGRTVDRGSDG